MLVWLFLALAVMLITTTVASVTMAVRAKTSDARKRYVRMAVWSGILTLITLVMGSLTRRRRDDTNYIQNFNDDLMMDGGLLDESFISQLVTST